MRQLATDKSSFISSVSTSSENATGLSMMGVHSRVLLVLSWSPEYHNCNQYRNLCDNTPMG